MATNATTLAPGMTTGRVASTLAIARRSVLKYLRTPQLVVLGTIQGALFLLIFRYVFGGAIHSGGLDYVNFLVPGFVTTGVLFSGMGSAAGVAEDLEQGFVDRLRSLPIPRSSVLVGGSVEAALGAFGLCVVFGFAFEWLFIALGLFAGTAQAAQGLAILVFPLTFVSSAYVPVASMPGWLQAFAQHQPITYMVDAVRALTGGQAAQAVLGHAAGYFVGRSLLWAMAIVAVFAPVAVVRYRRG